MKLKDIKPAIARQRVKLKRTGEIGEVYLGVISSADSVLVMTERGAKDWDLSDCEIIPESPRPFRVGDRVAYDAGTILYSTVSAVWSDGGDMELANGYRSQPNGHMTREWLRHCTPEEEAKYFA